MSIDEILRRVRDGYERIDAQATHEAAQAGDALLVDIRYEALRERDGLIPDALVVERNELEWRLDPLGSHRLPEATGHGLRVVVICNEGYASSLAVESLHRMGLRRATDLVGGFQAWRAAGLPVIPPAPGPSSPPATPAITAGSPATPATPATPPTPETETETAPTTAQR